jgi:hypothetical protein
MWYNVNGVDLLYFYTMQSDFLITVVPTNKDVENNCVLVILHALVASGARALFFCTSVSTKTNFEYCCNVLKITILVRSLITYRYFLRFSWNVHRLFDNTKLIILRHCSNVFIRLKTSEIFVFLLLGYLFRKIVEFNSEQVYGIW